MNSTHQRHLVTAFHRWAYDLEDVLFEDAAIIDGLGLNSTRQEMADLMLRDLRDMLASDKFREHILPTVKPRISFILKQLRTGDVGHNGRGKRAGRVSGNAAEGAGGETQAADGQASLGV